MNSYINRIGSIGEVLGLTVFVLCLSIVAFNYAHSEDKTTYTPTTELVWVEIPDSGGLEVSPVSGDSSKGEYISLLRFPAGLKTPVHTHTASYIGIVVTGNMKHNVPGKSETEKQLPPGSHYYIGGGVPHISECMAGVECVLMVTQKDKVDFIVVEEGK